MSNILLVFPPLGNHEHPHLGLPVLQSYLHANGYNSCSIKDYNVRIMDRIIRRLMAEEKELFSNTESDILRYYDLARNIMRGNSLSDKLKSGWAMDLISRYLKVLGLYIVDEKIGFDPISLKKVEEEFCNIDINSSDNLIVKYIREEVIPDILMNNPTIIGLSVVFASQVLYSLLICRIIRSIRPEIKIILGGAQISLFWQAIINNTYFTPFFDILVREQGEIPLLAIADYWIKGKGSMEDIPNVVYIQGENKIKINPIIDSESMDELPVPDFRDLPLELYAYPKLPYQMSRGCYWARCAFCGYRGCKENYTIAHKEKIVNDLKILKERHNIRIFHLMDDAILPQNLIDTAELIIANNLDVIYAAFLRTEKQFSNEACKILYKSGLRAVLFGFESANERILKLIDKGMTLKTMKEVLTRFKNAGIANYLSCIIGFPTEKKHEAYETLAFLVNNKDIYYKAYLTPFRLFSNMAEHSEKYSISNVDFNNPLRHDKNGYVSFEYTYDVSEGMSIDEFLQVLREGRKLVNSEPPGPIYYR